MSKIYIFSNDPETFNKNGRFAGQPYIAVAEDGEQLCGHFCSDFDYAMSDMSQQYKGHHYNAKYPEGYQLIFLHNGEFPPEEVMNKLKERNEPEKNSTEIKLFFKD